MHFRLLNVGSSWIAVLGLLATLAVMPVAVVAQEGGTSTRAANCLERVGEPYERGDSVYIKVKNICTDTIAVEYDVGVYKFGVLGTRISTSTDSAGIDPGKTAELCAKKPAAAGKYCFRFEVKNFDQTKPLDTFHRWLNNIQVAMFGGTATGDFVVGGSGFAEGDIALVADTPPGWEIELSTDYVAAQDFPATVSYTIYGPDGSSDEPVVLTVHGYDAVTGEWVSDANFTVGKGPDTAPTERGSDDGTAGGVIHDRSLDTKPVDVDGAPKPSLGYAGEESEKPAVGQALLYGWTEAGMLDVIPQAHFEYQGSDGWETIGTDGAEGGEALGVALALWDTAALEAGDYLVRVTMTDSRGLRGSTERLISVGKQPVAEATGTVTQSTVELDANGSFDPDGGIVDWAWDLGDGTVAYGPTVTHTYCGGNAYPVTMTVTDVDGFESTAVCTADLQKATFVCAATCGCEKMDIKGAGTTSTIPHHPVGGGGNNNGPMTPTWAGGTDGNHLAYKFEVFAKLKAGSDPALCTFKQWVKRTATYLGGTHDKMHNGQSYPVSGGSYAPDGPHTGNHASSAGGGGNPPSIAWVDGPGFHSLTAAQAGAGGALGTSYNAKFLAIVSGPAGTCKCTWEVDMKVNNMGGVVTAPTLKNKSCSP